MRTLGCSSGVLLLGSLLGALGVPSGGLLWGSPLGVSSGGLLWGSPLIVGPKVNFFSICIFFSFCRTRLGMKPSILKNDPLESDFNYQKTQQHKSNNRQEKLQDDMPSVGLVQSTTGFSSTSRTFLSSVLIILCNTCVILFCSSILF